MDCAIRTTRLFGGPRRRRLVLRCRPPHPEGPPLRERALTAVYRVFEASSLIPWGCVLPVVRACSENTEPTMLGCEKKINFFM